MVTGCQAKIDTQGLPGIVRLARKPISAKELVGHVETVLVNKPML
jgi:hypothetical protein